MQESHWNTWNQLNVPGLILLVHNQQSGLCYSDKKKAKNISLVKGIQRCKWFATRSLYGTPAKTEYIFISSSCKPPTKYTPHHSRLPITLYNIMLIGKSYNLMEFPPCKNSTIYPKELGTWLVWPGDMV